MSEEQLKKCFEPHKRVIYNFSIEIPKIHSNKTAIFCTLRCLNLRYKSLYENTSNSLSLELLVISRNERQKAKQEYLS
jgi:hypothetical protein